ncbi:MAG: hypothetical protein ACR2O4_11985 [Hyphomicrobiaceae bacterium]
MNTGSERHQVFQWNTGGWFGSQLGSTVWMFVCACLLLSRDLNVAAIAFALFLIPNIVGTALWAARRKINAYLAIQILLAVCWVCSLASVYLIERSGLWSTVSGIKIDGVGGTVSADSMKLLIIFMFPAMMFFFHLIQRRLRS